MCSKCKEKDLEVISLLSLIYEIRVAAGDDGKLMQDELVAHIRKLYECSLKQNQ